jgi:hypothetical protein
MAGCSREEELERLAWLVMVPCCTSVGCPLAPNVEYKAGKVDDPASCGPITPAGGRSASSKMG